MACGLPMNSICSDNNGNMAPKLQCHLSKVNKIWLFTNLGFLFYLRNGPSHIMWTLNGLSKIICLPILGGVRFTLYTWKSMSTHIRYLGLEGYFSIQDDVVKVFNLKKHYNFLTKLQCLKKNCVCSSVLVELL
jgi:hypothetical protein